MSTDKQQSVNFLNELIQEQMVVLGPSVALDSVRQIGEIQIDKSGHILEINADHQEVFNRLNRIYNEISPCSTNNIVLNLLTKYPNIQKPIL